MDYRRSLAENFVQVEVGQHDYRRFLAAGSGPVGEGGPILLGALELAYNKGPWVEPENLGKLNAVLRLSSGTPDKGWAATAMAYESRWTATDQVARRAIDSGLIGRFGTLDPTAGGKTRRASLSGEWANTDAAGRSRANVYFIDASLDLFSDFTYALDNPARGDQFEQAEHRKVFGLAASRSWNMTLGGRDSTTTVGLQVRHDRLDPVGLYGTAARERVATTQESTVRETSVGVYAENATQLMPWLRSVVGVRADRFDFKVDSSIAANSGSKSDSIVSPKLSLIFGPWAKTEYFVNVGTGFHSNDARGVNATVTPKEGLPADPSPGLVRSRGAEVGLRTEIVPGLQTSIALWQLKLGSELVFSGDAGDTEASGASKRTGIEINNHYVAAPWLLFDADLAFSRARFTEDQGEAPNIGRHIPGSVETVASLGATVTEFGPWFGHLQLRYFGPRALIEDDSQRSKATTLTYARVGYKITKDVKVMLTIVGGRVVFVRHALPGEWVRLRITEVTKRIDPETVAVTEKYYQDAAE